MLYQIVNNRTYTFYIGTTAAVMALLTNQAEDTVEIQADGHELEAIRRQFPGLIIPVNPSPRFFGDTAKLIAGNLNLMRLTKEAKPSVWIVGSLESLPPIWMVSNRRGCEIGVRSEADGNILANFLNTNEIPGDTPKEALVRCCKLAGIETSL